MKAKVVIFNVGGALSSYIEYGNTKIVIDLGKSQNFSPVNDFLIPYFEKKDLKKENNKFYIDQLIISHPHNDHISDIIDFDKNFYPQLFTIHNDLEGIKEEDKINWELVKNPNNDYVDYIQKYMYDGRVPPLRPYDTRNLFIYWISLKICEKELDKNNYANNISIVVYLRVNNHKVLFPGDIMKDGISYLIKNNSGFRNKLKDGVDFLIAPHHGLKSSFSTELFNNMKNNKTKRLNIISEKVSTKDTNRKIDSRYANKEYCEGKNNLSTITNPVYQRKTSNGHIFIDLSNKEPIVKIINNNDELLKEFLDGE